MKKHIAAGWRYVRYGRIVLGWIVMSTFLLGFLGVVNASALARWQLLPALLAGNVLAVTVLVLLTLCFGRVYCSVLCPLGLWQDFVSYLAERRKGGRRRYAYRQESWKLRYGVLAVLASGLLGGAAAIPLLLDPYTIFGRIATHLFAPAIHSGANQLIRWQIAYDGPDLGLAHTDVVTFGTTAVLVAAAYLIVISLVAWRYGRLYCQAFCPVGTLLGTVSRHAVLQLHFGTDCISCGLCAKSCPSSCIDVPHHRIDASRCIDCFTCVSVCPKGALAFGRPSKETITTSNAGSTQNLPNASRQPGESDNPNQPNAAPSLTRRQMIAGSALATLAAAGALTKGARGTALAAAPEKVVRPPGALSYATFSERCTGCHLCVASCPQGILRPANLEYGLGGIFQPRLDFTAGYCDPACTRCSDICPAGAITPVAPEKKKTLKIGTALYRPDTCVILTEGRTCGHCAEVCPIHAIEMADDGNGHLLPKVHHRRCIGCGSCEYHCPAQPKAIRVAGKEEQTIVQTNGQFGRGKK